MRSLVALVTALVPSALTFSFAGPALGWERKCNTRLDGSSDCSLSKDLDFRIHGGGTAEAVLNIEPLASRILIGIFDAGIGFDAEEFNFEFRVDEMEDSFGVQKNDDCFVNRGGGITCQIHSQSFIQKLISVYKKGRAAEIEIWAHSWRERKHKGLSTSFSLIGFTKAISP